MQARKRGVYEQLMGLAVIAVIVGVAHADWQWSRQVPSRTSWLLGPSGEVYVHYSQPVTVLCGTGASAVNANVVKRISAAGQDVWVQDGLYRFNCTFAPEPLPSGLDCCNTNCFDSNGSNVSIDAFQAPFFLPIDPDPYNPCIDPRKGNRIAGPTLALKDGLLHVLLGAFRDADISNRDDCRRWSVRTLVYEQLRASDGKHLLERVFAYDWAVHTQAYGLYLASNQLFLFRSGTGGSCNFPDRFGEVIRLSVQPSKVIGGARLHYQELNRINSSLNLKSIDYLKAAAVSATGEVAMILRARQQQGNSGCVVVLLDSSGAVRWAQWLTADGDTWVRFGASYLFIGFDEMLPSRVIALSLVDGSIVGEWGINGKLVGLDSIGDKAYIALLRFNNPNNPCCNNSTSCSEVWRFDPTQNNPATRIVCVTRDPSNSTGQVLAMQAFENGSFGWVLWQPCQSAGGILVEWRDAYGNLLWSASRCITEMGSSPPSYTELQMQFRRDLINRYVDVGVRLAPNSSTPSLLLKGQWTLGGEQ